ncbi:MAG TPA: FUSC family protein [Candidatus Binataceae bacterium]|nr:FUSC family protein [Candidatus Binataceae bacterium]
MFALLTARALAQSPVLMLMAIALFGAYSTYLIGRYDLGSAGLVTQVLVFDALYGVMYAPAQIGWSSAAAFGGVAIALGLIALFDNWFWPDPAEEILFESLADNLKRVRTTLMRSAADYVADDRRRPAPLLAHEMNATLSLLARAQAEGLSERRRAVLVAAITRLSRLRTLANEMVIANDPQIARVVRRSVAVEIRAAMAAVGAVLDELVDNPAAMLLTGPDAPPTSAIEQMRSAIAALDARVIELRPSYLPTTGAAELANVGAFLSYLHGVARLIERPLDEPADAGPASPSSPAALDPAAIRYCLKVALALVAGYVIGLSSQRADLSTIMTTILITVLPTYGAAARKMILRLIGAIAGGAAVVLMVIVVSPNFETLPVYVLAIFVVLIVSSYTGQGSGRIAYAGKQLGTTFLLAYVGLSPTTGVEASLWRVWAILLGTGIAIVASLVLWPEYAAASLLPRLRQLFKLTLALAPGGTADAAAIRAVETQLNGVLEQTLAVADDARLEGKASKVNADAVVQIAGTLRRIAHRFEGLAFQRIMSSRPELDAETENALRAALGAIVTQLEMWRAWIEGAERVASAPPDAQANQATMSAALSELGARIEAEGFARLRDWPPEQRRTLFAELESMRRLSVLMGELDDGLARLPYQ